MRSKVVLIATACLIAAGAALVGDLDGPPPIEQDRGTPVEFAASPAGESSGVALARHDVDAAGSPARIAASSRVCVPFEVRRWDTDAPVAQCEVVAFSYRTRIDSYDEIADWPAERAMRARTDATGVGYLSTPANGPPLRLFAEFDGLRGTTSLMPNAESEEQETSVLVLRPRSRLRVRAVDVAGRPVGGLKVSGVLIGKDKARLYLRTQTTDAATGMVEWQDFVIGLDTSSTPPKHKVTARVELASSSELRVELPITTRIVEGEIRIPATGTMVVRLTDPNGQAVVGQHGVSLRAIETDSATGEIVRKGWQTLPVVDSAARFSHIPLDEVLEIGAGARGHGQVVLGPTLAEPARVYTIALGHILRGRAVDGSGRPWSMTSPNQHSTARTVHLHAQVDDEHVWHRSRMDQHGQFSILLGERSLDRAFDTAVLILQPDGIPHDIIHQTPLQGDVVALGDIVFRPVQPTNAVLVAGRVHTVETAPCTNYRAWIQHRSFGGEWRTTAHRVEIEIGAISAFRAIGDGEPGEYRLCIQPAARCHLPPDPIEFEPGTTDIDLILERGVTLGVMIRHPAFETNQERVSRQSAIRLKLIATGGDALTRVPGDRDEVSRPNRQAKDDNTDDAFYWNGLADGVYRLEITGSGAVPIRTLDGIRISSDQGVYRSIDIDLRQELVVVALSFYDESGVAVKTLPRVTLLKPRTHEPCEFGRGAASDHNVMELMVVPGAVDVAIRARGIAPILIPNIRHSQRVQLTKAGAALRVRVAGLELPATVGARVVSTAAAANPSRGELWRHDERLYPRTNAATVGSDGVAVVTTSRLGVHDLEVQLFRRDGSTRAHSASGFVVVDGTAPQQVDVHAEASLEVVVSREAVRRALQSLRLP